MASLSRQLGDAAAIFASAMVMPFGHRASILARVHAAQRLRRPIEMVTDRGPLRMACSSRMAALRAIGQHDEPETRAWIDRSIQAGDMLWDVGANVGVFSLYAALRPEVQVFAFEPSAQTYATLMQNIELNGLRPNITAFCLALSDRTALVDLHLHGSEAGTSRHRLEKEIPGRKFEPTFSQPIMMYSVDAFIRDFNVRPPDHLKIDVDGPEPEIIAGARETLKTVKTVLIEIYDGTDEEKRILPMMQELGLREEPLGEGRFRNRLFVR